MKVLCDHMLGSLATWLRILGVDTAYPSNTMSDDEILRCAKVEGRFILTRDKTLAVRAKKAAVPVMLISSSTLAAQLEQAVEALSLDAAGALTRCTVCNTLLVPVDAVEAQPHVPLKVFARQKQFWFCPSCKKYYWMGTHYEDMEKKIAALMKQKSGLS